MQVRCDPCAPDSCSQLSYMRGGGAGGGLGHRLTVKCNEGKKQEAVTCNLIFVDARHKLQTCEALKNIDNAFELILHG